MTRVMQAQEHGPRHASTYVASIENPGWAQLLIHFLSGRLRFDLVEQR
jgi:hypothetical protein